MTSAKRRGVLGGKQETKFGKVIRDFLGTSAIGLLTNKWQDLIRNNRLVMAPSRCQDQHSCNAVRA